MLYRLPWCEFVAFTRVEKGLHVTHEFLTNSCIKQDHAEAPPPPSPSYPPFLGVEIRLKALAEVRFLQKYEQRAIVIRSFIAYLSCIRYMKITPYIED